MILLHKILSLPSDICLQYVGSVAIKCLIIMVISYLGDTTALYLAEAIFLLLLQELELFATFVVY